MKPLVSILLILAATFGGTTGLSSGGRVLCVSGDRHVAIEGRHAASCGSNAAHVHDDADHAADPSEPHQDAADGDHPAGAPDETCVDHGAAADTDGRQVRVAAPAHEAAGLATALHIASVARPAPSACAAWADPPGDHPPSASLARLATIVLLI
ncbi:MAG TPA: hypothetical protein VEA69_14630 [Tepidisphaeraceae bacterium]|nr:hypothetical protein [Tepidisphaeraceae bacterium]